jgi:hypothetical protein
MAVTTINIDEFLPTKLDGETVTAADWNRLVLLFRTINDNAFELLDLIKTVDINKANISSLALGSIPDRSISASKLEQLGDTKAVYILTEDTVPKADVTYYTLSTTVDGQTTTTVYTPHIGLEEFDVHEQYYTLETVPTEAAIASPEIIANGVITGDKIRDNTLTSALFTDLVLGGLLNDKSTIYTDKGVTDTLPADVTSRAHTIKFDKAHKVLVVINTTSLSVFMADTSKPDLHIGLTAPASSGAQELFIKHLIGVAKQDTIQTAKKAAFSSVYSAGAPYGLTGHKRLCLSNAYYQSDKQELYLKFTRVPNSDSAIDYSFGHLIIGL